MAAEVTHEQLRPPPAAVTRDELEAHFGADHLVRLPVDRLPAAVGDPGARAFLTAIGLPDGPAALVRPDDGFADGPRTLADYCAPDPAAEVFPGFPGDPATTVLLAHWASVPFVLDGATGGVHALLMHPDQAAANARPTHRDLHALARCLLAFEGEVLWLLSDLMDPDTADWCRDRFPAFAALFPARGTGEDLDDLDEDRTEAVDWPEVDDVLARLAARLDAVEPGTAENPVWQDVIRHFRYGF